MIKIKKNLYLSKYKSNYFRDILNYSKKEKFVEFMEYKPFTKLQLQKWIKQKLKNKDLYFYVIIYKSKVIGTYLITPLGPGKKRCDLSYGIDPDYHGLGIFQSITRKICKNLKFNRFEIITRVAHFKNLKSCKNLSFKKEGILKKYYFDLKLKKYFDGIILSYIK